MSPVDERVPIEQRSILALQTKKVSGGIVTDPLETLTWLAYCAPDLTIGKMLTHTPRSFGTYVFNSVWYMVDPRDVQRDVSEIQDRVIALGLRFADEDPWFIENGSIRATPPPIEQ